MNLWLFGSIAISSLFVVWGWSVAAWLRREPLSHWNAALMLALAVDVGAIALFAASGVRASQLLAGDPTSAFFSGWMVIALSGLFASKGLLVWVACIRKGRQVLWLWPVYLASLLLWAGFCAVWRH